MIPDTVPYTYLDIYLKKRMRYIVYHIISCPEPLVAEVPQLWQALGVTPDQSQVALLSAPELACLKVQA